MAWPDANAHGIQHNNIVTPENDLLASNESSGRLRMEYFSFTTGIQSVGFVWHIARLPINARLLGSTVFVSESPGADLNMGLAGLSRTPGILINSAYELASKKPVVVVPPFAEGVLGILGTLLGGAGIYTFIENEDELFGTLLREVTTVTMTPASSITTSTKIAGFIQYAVD